MSFEAALASLYEKIDRLTREKSEATSDLICAHREIERHKQEIARLDGVAAGLAGSHARLREENDELRARLAGAEAANAATTEMLVEHSELSGHIDLAEQCRDYLAHEAMDEGDPSGRLRDFVESLRIVIDQLDVQRRCRNWYEVAYSAGKQKLIEYALDKSLASARDAARRFAAHVSDLGAFVDDNDPRAIATAGPIGRAQADLWIALGMSIDDEAASMQADIVNRCAVCGWTLAESADKGCVRGNCSMRPRPAALYAPERAEKERSDAK